MTTRTPHRLLWLALLLTLAAHHPAISWAEGLPSLPASVGEQTRQTILNDPLLLQKVLELQNDPSFKAVLNDPALMQAIQSGNLGVLTTHPALRQLMSHPIIQEIKNKQPSTP